MALCDSSSRIIFLFIWNVSISNNKTNLDGFTLTSNRYFDLDSLGNSLKLTYLDVPWIGLLPRFCNPDRLRSLIIREKFEVKLSSAELLNRSRNLEHLTISGIGLSESFINELALPNLSTVVLFETDATSAVPEFIKKFSNLKKLTIRVNAAIASEWDRIRFPCEVLAT